MITMQPFLDDYQNAMPLGKAIVAFLMKNPNHKLAIAIQKMHKAYVTLDKLKDVIENLKDLNYQMFDVKEQLIYFLFLGHSYCNLKLMNNAYSILNASKKLITETLPIEWQLIPLQIEAQIASEEGHFSIFFQLQKEILNKERNHSKRFYLTLHDHLCSICATKYQSQFSTLYKEYQNYCQSNNDNLILICDLICAFELANLHLVPHIISELQKDKNLNYYSDKITKASYLYNFLEKNLISEINVEDKSNWDILSLKYLKEGDYKKALEWAHKKYELTPDYYKHSNFLSFSLIRAELANKNTHAALYSLEQRKNREDQGIFIDFFYFRAYHILNNKKLAQTYFNHFYQNILKYNLEKRLDFEITLSPELSLFNLMQYSQTYKDLQSTINTPIDSKSVRKNDFAGKSYERPISQDMQETIEQFSKINLPILIIGETGTGKEIMAKEIHNTKARNKPFIPINCAYTSVQLLQSELFGHLKSAFTGAYENRKGIFEEAQDGTVFLDEIGEICPKTQVLLLRLLETGEYRPIGSTKIEKIRCNIIMATNQNLNQLVKKNIFREDLKFRLERIVLEIPPLRKRTRDILTLVNYYLNTVNPDLPDIHFDSTALEHLCSLPWKGNIRELRNEIEKVRLFHSDKKVLTINELSENYKPKQKTL